MVRLYGFIREYIECTTYIERNLYIERECDAQAVVQTRSGALYRFNAVEVNV